MWMVADTLVAATLQTGRTRAGQNRIEINASLLVGQRFNFFQQVTASNDVFELFKTQVSQVFAHLLCNETEVIHHQFGQAVEMFVT